MTPAKVRAQVSSPPARFGTVRGDGPSDGEFVAELLGKVGFELLPWQRQVLDTGLELDRVGGLPKHRDVVVTTPRQQGKSLLMFGLVLHRLLLLPDQVILYGAVEDGGQDPVDRFVVADVAPVAARQGSDP